MDIVRQPADGVLGRCVLTGRRVDMTVDQAGHDSCALGVHDNVGLCAAGADLANDTVLDIKTVGLEHRPVENARAQRADVMDQERAHGAARRSTYHSVIEPGSEPATRSTVVAPISA